MRRDAHIVRAEPAIEPQQALLPRDLDEAVHHALVGQFPVGPALLLLQPRLGEVEGQAEEAGEEAGDGARGERLRLRRPRGARPQLRLGLREEGQLAQVERHGPHHGRRGAGPQPRDALGPHDGRHGVEDGLVVLALGDGLQAVRLHADEREIGRVADEGRDAARREAGARAFREADLRAFVLGARRECLHEGVEEAQAGRRVDGLAEEAGGEARVKIEDFALSQDLASHRYGRGFGSRRYALAGKLESDFDHVNGLDDRRGHHARYPTVDEWQGRSHDGRVEEVVFCGRHGFDGLGALFGHAGRLRSRGLGGLLQCTGAHYYQQVDGMSFTASQRARRIRLRWKQEKPATNKQSRTGGSAT